MSSQTPVQNPDQPEDHGQVRIRGRHFVPVFFTTFGIQILTIAQGILLARWLGPEGRGQFAAAILWPTFFAGVWGWGLSTALARRAANADPAVALGRTAIEGALLSGLSATCACAALLPWLLSDAAPVTQAAAWWFLPWIVFNHLANSFSALDLGSGRLDRYNRFRLLVNPLYLTAIVILMIIGIKDLRWFVATLALTTVIVASLRLSITFSQPASEHRLSLSLLIREGMPFGLASLFVPLLITADRALLLFLVGETQLGLYVVAHTASSVLGSVATSAATITFGMSAQSAARAGSGSITQLVRLTGWLWVIAGAVLACGLPLLIPMVYGREFTNAIWPAVLLIPGAALAGQAAILEEALRAQGHAFVGVAGRLAGLVALLGLGWWLVPSLGLTAMAAASFVANAVALGFIARAAIRHFDALRWGDLLPGWKDVIFGWKRLKALTMS